VNFETMNFLLAAIIQQLVDQGVISDAPVSNATGEICTGAVKVFRLPNGALEVYSGFDPLPPNGFQVAQIPLAEQLVGGVFSLLDAPIPGWTATLEVIDGAQRIVVRDAAGNVVGNTCPW